VPKYGIGNYAERQHSKTQAREIGEERMEIMDWRNTLRGGPRPPNPRSSINGIGEVGQTGLLDNTSFPVGKRAQVIYRQTGEERQSNDNWQEPCLMIFLIDVGLIAHKKMRRLGARVIVSICVDTTPVAKSWPTKVRSGNDPDCGHTQARQ